MPANIINRSIAIGIVCFSAFSLSAKAAPRVVQSVPEDGDPAVDPGTTQLVIRFDSEMNTGNYSILPADKEEFPEPTGEKPFAFRDAKTFIMHVELAPHKTYAIRLNSPTRQGFRASDGTPLEPVVIRFRTSGPSVRPGESAAPDEKSPRLDSPSAEGEREPSARSAPTRDRSSSATPRIPSDWTLLDNKLFGTRVGVPPGWTPRIRGDVCLCVEPDDLPRASAFIMPLRLGTRTSPDELANGFDAMMRGLVPDWQAKTADQLTAESVQRKVSATVSQIPVVGTYRAVVGRFKTGFIMGYLAPADRVEQLRPVFHQILASYRYDGPRMRLMPYRTEKIELLKPPDWTIRTSENDGGLDTDVRWAVTCPQVSTARVFNYSPKFFTPNWAADPYTLQPDPNNVAQWRLRGFEMLPMSTDQAVMQAALNTTLPGLEIVRSQSLDEMRRIFEKQMSVAFTTINASGGKMSCAAFELLGRRQVDGVPMRCMVNFGLWTMITPSARGPAAIWRTSVRGFEAPPDRFATLAPTFDRIASSFTYTLPYLTRVMEGDQQRAKIMRDTMAHMNRVDRDIWDNHMRTRDAISEMMYDTLTGNYGYLNEKTGTIEKIPADEIQKFTRPDGTVVSPEEVVKENTSVQSATPVREAFSDDYMSFDRRVQVWP